MEFFFYKCIIIDRVGSAISGLKAVYAIENGLKMYRYALALKYFIILLNVCSIFTTDENY